MLRRSDCVKTDYDTAYTGISELPKAFRGEVLAIGVDFNCSTVESLCNNSDTLIKVGVEKGLSETVNDEF